MRATGIVRRIDDLGRVVIPKEIRRTLRIREGDPLEIYTDSGGEVIFKKYSPLGEISGFAEQYAEVISSVAKLPVIMTDRDHVIAVAGVSKKEFLDRRISSALEEMMENRRSFAFGSSSAHMLFPVESSGKAASVTVPIISAGDITGCLVILDDGSGSAAKESDIKLARAGAAFLGRQNED